MLRIGAPIGTQFLLESGAFGVVALLMGWLGVSQVAAHQVVLNLCTKYEPRLERVRIRPLATTPLEFRLSFELSAAMKGGDRISFQTSFTSNGETHVQPLRARSA